MQLTPDEAKKQLDQARPVGSPQHRRSYGLSIALFGLLIGANFTIEKLAIDTGNWASVGNIAFGLALAAFLAWWIWGVRVKPRHADVVAGLALLAALVVMMVGHGTLNWIYRDGEVATWAAVAFGVGIVVPPAVAGAFLARKSPA